MESKFKVGDKCKVINSIDSKYNSMIGKIVTISRIQKSTIIDSCYFYYIKEKYYVEKYEYQDEYEKYEYQDEYIEYLEGEPLDLFFESELELSTEINPKDLLLRKLK